MSLPPQTLRSKSHEPSQFFRLSEQSHWLCLLLATPPSGLRLLHLPPNCCLAPSVVFCPCSRPSLMRFQTAKRDFQTTVQTRLQIACSIFWPHLLKMKIESGWAPARFYILCLCWPLSLSDSESSCSSELHHAVSWDFVHIIPFWISLLTHHLATSHQVPGTGFTLSWKLPLAPEGRPVTAPCLLPEASCKDGCFDHTEYYWQFTHSIPARL